LALALDIVALTGYVRYLLDLPDLSPLLAGLEHPAIKQFPELAHVRSSQAAAPDLTDQELAILRLLAERRTNAEIADKLVITVGTVKWHLHNIYRKLGVRNRRAAVARGEALDYF
jgi:LuxR family maltose regulon positive regulatory protein